MTKLLLVGCLLGFSGSALGYPIGITGYSGKGGHDCNDCHQGASMAPTVTLSGQDTLEAGAQAMYQFVIQGGAGVAAGFDIALSSSAATLVAITDQTQVASGELTHRAPLPFVDGKVTVAFMVKAPLTVGTLIIYAAGNSTDGSRDEFGDQAATTTRTISIQVPDGGVELPTTDAAIPITDAAIPATDAGSITTDKPDAGGAPPDPGPAPTSSSGCAVGGHFPATNVVLVIGYALALLVRRRVIV